jgi:hypothetical protein
MGATAHDVVQSLGDALAGVDRNAQFLKGQELGATIDEKRSSTEAAMALAKQRRIDAEVVEAKKQRDDAIAAMNTAQLTDPNTAPIGTMIAAGRGSDYSGATEGLLHSQQLGERRTVETPAPLGDDIAEARRQAALEALAPASAIATQRGGGSPVIAQDPDNPGQDVYIPPRGGSPVQVTTPRGPSTARPASRPTPAPTRSREVDYLVGKGWDQHEAEQLVFGPKANPESLYNAVYAAEVRNFAKPEDAAKAAKAAVVARFGADAGEQATTPQRPRDPGEPQLPGGVPRGSRLYGHTKDGHEVYETPDGSKLVVE